MTKKKTMKNIKTPNKFNIGGFAESITIPDSALGILSKLTTSPTVKPGELIQTWDPNFKSQKTLSEFFQNFNSPGIASGIAGAASNAISQGRSTIGGNIVGTIGNAISTINPLLGGAITMAGGAINNLYGASYNDANIEKVESDTSTLNAFNSVASDTTSLAREASSISRNFGNFNKDFIGKDGAFSYKINDKYQELVRNRNIGKQNVINQLNNSATNISASTLDNLERNYAAFGGPLFAYGGQTHGADFTNGLMFINNGGTHESNPYEGVPISMDQEGNPNLVEEGEVIWNDYVFSNRLKVPKSVQKKYKLGKREMTFANAIDKLSKESEERPNDPISMRGLEDILTHMAIEQETLKSKQQPKNTEKNKFNTGGDTNPYKSYSWIPGYNGGWFDEKGKYTQAYKDYVNAITKEQMLQAFNNNYNYYLNDANKGTDRYNAIAKFYAANPNYNAALTELSDDMFNRSKKLMIDGKPGFMHHVAAAMMSAPTESTPQAVTANRYFIRNADGTVTPMAEDLIPFEGLNENGRTWAELNPNYVFRGKQVRPQETIDGVPTTYTDYYYDPKIEEAPKESTTPSPAIPSENLPTWMRYAPVIGHGALAITDAFGLTNKPDYSNTEAVISAARGIRSNPIKFTPIGDYLAYNPFDTEYHANQLRAVSGATRRNIMNTSSGNRATAMAGILASDNNTMNQLGDLYRKAAEYNLEQRHKVTDFNRATNMFNKEGAFKSDAANQSAALQARGLGFEGLLKGYTMKEQANLLSDQAKAANISGLLTSLGNIGYENANRNMMNWGMATGTWAPSQWKYDPLTGKPVNK